jgi:hypothetical protein
MKVRILIIATLAVLCPTLSSAGDVVAMLDPSPVIATTSISAAIEKNAKATPRPQHIQLACSGLYVRCVTTADCCTGLKCTSATGTASDCR